MTSPKVLKGTYCLLINLKSHSKITIGKLGTIDFKKGHYVYVGSALNSLNGRILRHLKEDKKLHWHIDYFLASANSEIEEVIYTVSDEKLECELARKIAERGSGISEFGCSDCKCESHLFFFKDHGDLELTCFKAFRKLDLELKKFIN